MVSNNLMYEPCEYMDKVLALQTPIHFSFSRLASVRTCFPKSPPSLVRIDYSYQHGLDAIPRGRCAVYGRFSPTITTPWPEMINLRWEDLFKSHCLGDFPLRLWYFVGLGTPTENTILVIRLEDRRPRGIALVKRLLANSLVYVCVGTFLWFIVAH